MNCAIYIRKSREEKDKPSHRLTVQREQLPVYADNQGWSHETYDDGHASAARGKTEDLKERGRLEADIRAGRIGVILTIELSRLSRDDSLQDYVAWLHLCGEHRVKLATMSRILDPGQHSDWMLLLMEGGFSSVEMRVLHSRMAEGRAQAAREGKFLGGQLPPPYVHGKSKSAPVIDEQALVRMQRIWALAETHSTRQIADTMRLPLIAVRRAISDDRLLFYRAKREDAQGGLVDCEWEPCMDADQAERIRSNRKNRFSGGARRSAGGLLTNLDLFVCGYCGRSVRSWTGKVRKDGTRLNSYGCKANELKRLCEPSRMLGQEIVDDRVATNLIGTIANTPKLKECWDATIEGDDSAQQLSVIDDQRKGLQLKKDRLVAAIVEGVLTFADGKKKREEIDAALYDMEQQRTVLLQARRAEPNWEEMAATRDEFEEMDFGEKREYLSLAIRQIRLFSTYLIIEYRFPRSMSGDPTARVHLPPPAKTGPKPYKAK